MLISPLTKRKPLKPLDEVFHLIVGIDQVNDLIEQLVQVAVHRMIDGASLLCSALVTAGSAIKVTAVKKLEESHDIINVKLGNLSVIGDKEIVEAGVYSPVMTIQASEISREYPWLVIALKRLALYLPRDIFY